VEPAKEQKTAETTNNSPPEKGGVKRSRSFYEQGDIDAGIAFTLKTMFGGEKNYVRLEMRKLGGFWGGGESFSRGPY